MHAMEVKSDLPYIKSGGHELDMGLQKIDDYTDSHIIMVEVRKVKGAPRALRKYYGGSKADFQKVTQGTLLCLTQAAVCTMKM